MICTGVVTKNMNKSDTLKKGSFGEKKITVWRKKVTQKVQVAHFGLHHLL